MSLHARRTAIVAAVLVILAVGAIVLVTQVLSPASPRPASSPTPTPTLRTSATAGSPSPTVAPRPTSSTAPAPTPIEPPTATPTPDTVVTPTLTTVGVVTTFSGWNQSSSSVEVGGYAETIEPDGSCTLTLTLHNTTVTRSRTAVADASTTSCGSLTVPSSDLSAGTWQAILSYSSSHSTGRAAPVMIEVP